MQWHASIAVPRVDVGASVESSLCFGGMPVSAALKSSRFASFPNACRIP
jgi:hypothetical protein